MDSHRFGSLNPDPDPHWGKMLDLDTHWVKRLDPDPHWNQCGSATLLLVNYYRYVTILPPHHLFFRCPITFRIRRISWCFEKFIAEKLPLESGANKSTHYPPERNNYKTQFHVAGLMCSEVFPQKNKLWLFYADFIHNSACEYVLSVLRIQCVYPGYEFFNPVSRVKKRFWIRITELGILTLKLFLSSRKNNLGCSPRIRNFFPSRIRIQGSKRHRICCVLCDFLGRTWRRFVSVT